MDYDTWKLQTPDSFDYEEAKTCINCTEEIADNKDFCSKFCAEEYNL
jgi:hypothetical protein